MEFYISPRYEFTAKKYPFKDEFSTFEEYKEAVGVKNMRPTINHAETPKVLANLIQSCWHANPAKRPKCEQIISVLSDWKV